MTENLRTDLEPDNSVALATFHADVARMGKLSPEAFADLDPRTFSPLTAAFSVVFREVDPS